MLFQACVSGGMTLTHNQKHLSADLVAGLLLLADSVLSPCLPMDEKGSFRLRLVRARGRGGQRGVGGRQQRATDITSLSWRRVIGSRGDLF